MKDNFKGDMNMVFSSAWNEFKKLANDKPFFTFFLLANLAFFLTVILLGDLVIAYFFYSLVFLNFAYVRFKNIKRFNDDEDYKVSKIALKNGYSLILPSCMLFGYSFLLIIGALTQFLLS
ncbi:hypothetical protein [Photobacterium leiognathi]|uniref:hypothetical protein n=1 Tax=Photobacterium leiognathi TaxID=553611 RepID=UPI0029818A41|nr:hypothetical protein [Photobacterium leiognathi]